ncbi:N-acetylglucosamine-induced protein 1 [Sphaceloma murrayae]|uniref:N-acetylglucosamine-induced protein 1 n=1 Tax=Sphaceloma murrayae TaxID=2082308 RepID=A0A2K1QYT5_9PEZI|nr:N-acetylglucosamine-induced protein 1 [Sphaceloma murrayae]
MQTDVSSTEDGKANLQPDVVPSSSTTTTTTTTTTETMSSGGIPLTSIDREILAMKDSDFHLLTWSDLRHIILDKNALEELKRRPSDLRRYVAWSADIKSQYGGITSYVIRERLHWPPVDTSAAVPTFAYHNAEPFADDRDYQILLNDWPYGLEEGIKHLVVWTKALIETDGTVGDVTPASRKVIESFVETRFVRDLDEALGVGEGKERVLWFKNWVSLQSVRGVDHIHLMIRGAPEKVLDGWLKRTSEPLEW